MVGIRSRSVAALLAAVISMSACSDSDPADAGDEPNVASIVLTVGGQTVTWTRATGAVTGGPIIISAGSTNPVSATFLMANGSADPLVTSATFELRVTPANTTVTFARTGAFTGTLTGAAAPGNTSATFALFHLAEGHNEYDFSVPITVAPVVAAQ